MGHLIGGGLRIGGHSEVVMGDQDAGSRLQSLGQPILSRLHCHFCQHCEMDGFLKPYGGRQKKALQALVNVNSTKRRRNFRSTWEAGCR